MWTFDVDHVTRINRRKHALLTIVRTTAMSYVICTSNVHKRSFVISPPRRNRGNFECMNNINNIIIM